MFINIRFLSLVIEHPGSSVRYSKLGLHSSRLLAASHVRAFEIRDVIGAKKNRKEFRSSAT